MTVPLTGSVELEITGIEVTTGALEAEAEAGAEAARTPEIAKRIATKSFIVTMGVEVGRQLLWRRENNKKTKYKTSDSKLCPVEERYVQPRNGRLVE